MSEQRPVPPRTPAGAHTALWRAGAEPLNRKDPDRIGPYLPLGLLGSGGMGRVYLARPADGSPGLAAVKVIRPEYAEDPGFRRRFEHEAAVHARVGTCHSPPLLGTGFHEDLLWMATEYLPGLDVAEAVRESGPLPPAAVWRLVGDLGQALMDLGAAGIVHRDLKPSNVLLTAASAHVIDFGVSKAADASAITGTGNRVGTPAYMSPEHLREGRCDTASDVFSLAGTLVYAATGHAPFGDGTGVDVMHRVAFEEPNRELIEEISTADAELGALLSACLAKDPGLRPGPQDLIGAAARRAVPVGWPEPLNGELAGRQRAYEELRGSALPSDPTPGRETAVATGDPEAAHPVEKAADTGTGADRAEASGTADTAGATGPAGASATAETTVTGSRRDRRLLAAVATGVAVSLAAAGAVLLTRQDAPASAAPGMPGAATRAHEAPSHRAARPGGPDTTTPTTSVAPGGTAAEGNPNPVPDGGTPRPDDTGRNGSAPSAAPGGTSAGPDPAPSASVPASTPSPTPTQSAAPAWVTDCTHYSGSELTRRGDTGERVLQVQCMLSKRGYDLGKRGVDGKFSKATKMAVRQFQTDRGLAVDGKVGPETWAALRSTT